MILKTDFPVEIFKTDRRKTASIKIVDGGVHVIVPKRLSDARVKDLIPKSCNCTFRLYFSCFLTGIVLNKF